MIETIRKVYDEINAMGGRPDQDNSYDQGIVDTVAKVLDVLEREFPALVIPAVVGGSHDECERCNGTGIIGLRARTGTYVAPGPVPEDARGFVEATCDVCRGSGVAVGGSGT